ncbi:O-acetylhomoserine aminocarboxypropyltransferase/cysteine synthase family protein [Paeniglutamicibacter psychrophenolicus]|uniref:O-acetylhomoserine aminocarboxypropyltransferase/cysteine synthase family protein n=1 Tax=Paeniglutamicibacter psychrophenolicus TaxID=257454 RepID=UPI00278AA01D|nr:aminotransferase class I/II-fold pyridoxal phosphate-dependent enzyme [Paeniglutamicibacter psychrophenolicus]MDQ0092516.1 O-acetylhomoserine (thiol)-lyase [Paeniglutamicibacter psychrophenolicus]
MASSSWHNATTEIHAGYSPAGEHRPMTVPIYNTAAYQFPDYATAAQLFSLKEPGFTYSRTGNPTVAVLEERAAALEGGIGAIATATGQAAVALSLLALLQGPNHLVASSKLYGGTVDLLTDTFADFGITVTFVDPEDPANWAAAITEKTRGFLLESVSNPLATLVDLRAITDLAHAAGIPVVVDNTLATPAAYRPIEFGADIVVHSATKALSGHGSVLGGLVIDAGTFDFTDAARWPQIAGPKARYYGDSLLGRYGAKAYLMLARSKFLHDLGPTLSAASASSILTGIETLSLRVAKAQANVLELVEALGAHPAVARVHHPSVPTHQDHELAKEHFPEGTGCVFSFDLKDPAAVPQLVDSLKLFALAANIGDARSLIVHPAAMTHCRLNDAQLAAAGIAPGTLRLSVGLEDARDLVADLISGLDALGRNNTTTETVANAPRETVNA